MYRGGAPIFITTKKADVDKLAGSCDGDASMLFRRLKVYKFNVRVAAPAGKLTECAHCFAKLVCTHGA